MAQQTINIGAAPDDGTGDTIRAGGAKINENFTELYAFDATVAGTVAAAITAHEGAANPHPTYLTAAEGDAAYAALAAAVPVGGLTGQVLKKTSNADLDTEWADDETAAGGPPAGVVPVGGIVMWSGTVAAIPTDWALCDGAANSPGPDLRDKFVVGAKQDDAGIAKTNLTGSLTQGGAAAASAHSLTTSVAVNAHSLSTQVAVDAHTLSTSVAVSAHTLSTDVAVSAHTLSTNVALSAHSLTTNVAIADHTLVGAAGRTSTASTRSFITTAGALTHTITQPVVGVHTITQPVVAAHTITQPVVAAHSVTQPVVAAHAITQPVVANHAVTQPVVGDHSSLWPTYFALAFIQRMA